MIIGGQNSLIVMSQLVQIREHDSNKYTKLKLVPAVVKKDINIIGTSIWEIKFPRDREEYNRPIYSILQKGVNVDIRIFEIFEYDCLWGMTIYTIDNAEIKEFTDNTALIAVKETKWKWKMLRGSKLLKKKYIV